MDNNKICSKIIEASNIASLENISDFVRTYIEKLVYNISMYVEPEFSLGSIEILSDFSGRCELSQAITGIPSAYSCIDGKTDALVTFAEHYSHLGITSFDMLAREAILDFLNLHNGLFLVNLSETENVESTLTPPTSDDNGEPLESYPDTYIMPVEFKFGTVNFVLSEK